MAVTSPRPSDAPTTACVWYAGAGGRIDNELLEWPPELLAFTEMILTRSEAYRFALSPPGGETWPPEDLPTWPDAVAEAGREWCAWLQDRSLVLPELLERHWETFREANETTLTDLSEASDWRLCVALLTLHAIADEACAGLGVELTASDGRACAYRARGREVLARTGTLARIPPHFLRVLPKVRTSPSGSSSRALSRYASVHGPAVEARWHKVLGQRQGTEPRAQGANFLLLPWPLRVRESDFRPIEARSGFAKEPWASSEFVPREALDLDLVDRMLIAARRGGTGRRRLFAGGSVDGAALCARGAIEASRRRCPDRRRPPTSGATTAAAAELGELLALDRRSLGARSSGQAPSLVA